MTRFLRPLLVLAAVLLLAGTGRANGSDRETAAPTGRVVVQFTAGATAADRARIASVADAAPEPRIDPAVLSRTAAKSRRPSAALDALARYEQFTPPTAGRDALVKLARRLAADPAVTTAFLEPRAVPAALGFDAFTGRGPEATGSAAAPLPTEDFTEWQGYMGDAPMGIGAWSAWSQPGARGGTVRIIDVEGAWLWDHEDLPTPFADLGLHIDDLGWRNHGTAVMGEMRGIDNEYGIDGIVPDCAVGNSSVGDQSVAGALLNAAANLESGDLVLIELHAPGPESFEDGGQFGYVPMEFWQDNFDAIRALTDMGIVVVEAAGNGQQDLDDPVFLDLFDRQVRDSGAIMVGATAGSSTTPAWFTNHGSRVDLCGWGQNVATCGYGDLQEGDETEWYTVQFSGTSSASPIVTGAAASLQGMAETAFGFSLDAAVIRDILRQTGTPSDGPQLIGPRPDLVAAWALASQGVGLLTGTVAESPGGAPIAGAEITVQPAGRPTVVTGADGSYRLTLIPGSYDLAVSSYFHADAVEPVTVTAGTGTRDITLSTLALKSVGGVVVDAGNQVLAGATVTMIDEPVADAATGPDGGFAFAPVPVGLAHEVLAGGVPGLGGAYRPVAAGERTDNLRMALPPATYTFETGTGGFTAQDTLWQRGRPADTGMGPGAAFDGDWCWGIGLDGAGYPDDAGGELWSPVITGTAGDGDRLLLSFHFWSGTEAGFDGVHVVLDPEGTRALLAPIGGYTDAMLNALDFQAGWSGTTIGWRTAVFDVTDMLAETSWRFALRFASDGGFTDAGFLVDGVTLHAVHTIVAVPDDGPPDVAAIAVSAWPNPFNPRVNLAWDRPDAGRLDLAIFDLRGRLVRRLLDGDAVPARGQATWDGADRAGRAAPSGVYLVRAAGSSGPPAVRRITLAR